MDEHDVKGELGYSDIINEDIERKLKRAEIYKKFMTYMNNYEETLDTISIPVASPEEQKRRKKATSFSYVESIRLDDEEVVKDLNSCSRDPSANVRVLDSVLYIKNNKFVRGDKVLVKGKKEEYVASISAIDEDEIAIKTKENKRLRINVDDLKRHIYNISRWSKK